MSLSAAEIEMLIRLGAELGLASLKVKDLSVKFGTAPVKPRASLLGSAREVLKEIDLPTAVTESELAQWFAQPLDAPAEEE